jgi:hypothetical protein
MPVVKEDQAIVNFNDGSTQVLEPTEFYEVSEATGELKCGPFIFYEKKKVAHREFVRPTGTNYEDKVVKILYLPIERCSFGDASVEWQLQLKQATETYGGADTREPRVGQALANFVITVDGEKCRLFDDLGESVWFSRSRPYNLLLTQGEVEAFESVTYVLWNLMDEDKAPHVVFSRADYKTAGAFVWVAVDRFIKTRELWKSGADTSEDLLNFQCNWMDKLAESTTE